MLELRSPKDDKEWEDYFNLRYELLRKPHNQPRGSEKDDKENIAFHCAAFWDDEIIGVGRLHWIEDKAQIRYMAVKEDNRNNKIGTKILEYLENQALLKNTKIIFLNARERAVNFYQRNGYILVKTLDSFLGIKHFRMEKKL
jgi:N-acetylglutamate synthase-like GNAT family acetyltransferase